MILLRRAKESDCPEILEIQRKAFMPLLEKYQDYGTNPAAEDIEQIYRRFRQPFTHYYLIAYGGAVIGMLRVCDHGEFCRLSPVCILTEYQGYGYGREVLMSAEALYPEAKYWVLDTIAQEEKLCRFYEKLGYRKTGQCCHIKPGMDLVFYRKDLK